MSNETTHPPFLYDFFRPNLWQRRINSMDDLVDTTFKLFDSTLLTIDGLTVRKFAQLLQKADGSDYEELVTHLEQEPNEENYQRLIEQIENDRKASEATFQLMKYKFASLLEARRLPLSISGYENIDLDFELTQLLNLYTLCSVLNKFVWSEVKSELENVLNSYHSTGELPSLHLMRSHFQHIANDVEIIQRAIVQRRRERNSVDKYIMSSQARALLIADKFALLALAPFEHLLPSEPHVTPITYLSRETHFHHVPYNDNFILIGIRYDHIPPKMNWVYSSVEALRAGDDPLPSFEFMAIPHEIGHYIYRYADLDKQAALENWCDDSERMLAHPWCEEIFADAYGCLIAGPLLALSLQALLAYTDTRAICANDGAHPPAILRPFILSAILQALQKLAPDRYASEMARYHLNVNWAMLLERRGYMVDGDVENGVCVIQGIDGYEINVGRQLEQIRPIIYGFAQLLLDNARYESDDTLPPNALSVSIPWSHGDYDDLLAYDGVMTARTDFDFAGKKVAHHTISDYKRNRRSGLQRFLWKDSGPLTIGGHGRTSTYTDAQLRDNRTDILARHLGVVTKQLLDKIATKYAGRNVSIAEDGKIKVDGKSISKSSFLSS